MLQKQELQKQWTTIAPLSRPHAWRADEKTVPEAALKTDEANLDPKTENDVQPEILGVFWKNLIKTISPSGGQNYHFLVF